MIILFLCSYFFLIPGFIVSVWLADPGIRSNQIPRAAWSIFRGITPRYERWATERVESGKAGELGTENIAGTEWPLFGSVFYLWAVESLQQAWEENPELAREAPAVYARGAIDAATRLVVDPNHATWVKIHWGDNYLNRENIFYRALIVAATTSHIKLTGSDEHVALLREQVESLTAELESSPHGVLNDYPGECYPTDVLTTIACVRRADEVLGTDHSEFVKTSLRGFSGNLLDSRGLPPYMADPVLGRAYDPSRGCGISYALLNAPYLWPDVAKQWYDLYEQYFWQEKYGLSGFREFPNDLDGGQFYWDVDAGPVVGGVGVAATAFGVAAARINGRFDHAYPLTAEMVTFTWPLPNGVLLMPRLLSNAAHAPLLGEACILFNLASRAAPGVELVKEGTRIPLLVWVGLSLYFGLGLIYVMAAFRELRRWRGRRVPLEFPLAKLQVAVWIALVCIGVVLAFSRSVTMGALALLVAQLFPHQRK